MGWTFTRDMDRNEMIRERTEAWESDTHKCVCLKFRAIGKTLWKVLEITEKATQTVKRFIALDLIESDRKNGYGYKDMEESMLPYSYNCPLSFLKMVPEVANETWRKRVVAYHALQSIKPELGKTYKTIGLAIPEVKIVQVKPLRGEFAGAVYRIKAKYLELGIVRPEQILTPDEQAEKDALDGGQALRCSALGGSDQYHDRIHVLFRRKDGSTEGWYMASATYHAIPLGTLATPDDYRKHGELIAAPNEYDFGGTTKEVAVA